MRKRKDELGYRWSKYLQQSGKDCGRIGIYFGVEKDLSMSAGM